MYSDRFKQFIEMWQKDFAIELWLHSISDDGKRQKILLRRFSIQKRSEKIMLLTLSFIPATLSISPGITKNLWPG